MSQRALRADAEANLERIIDAATDVFSEHGLEVSIEVVAQRAGLGLGTIYRRFENKEALILELVRRLLTDVVACAEAHLEDPGGVGLIRYLFDVCQILATKRGTVARLWSDPSSADLVSRSRQLQKQLLANAKAHGIVRPELAPEDVAVALWSVHGILDVTKGLPIVAWRRHLELLVAGFMDHECTISAPPIAPAQMTRIIQHSPSASGSAG